MAIFTSFSHFLLSISFYILISSVAVHEVAVVFAKSNSKIVVHVDDQHYSIQSEKKVQSQVEESSLLPQREIDELNEGEFLLSRLLEFFFFGYAILSF